MSAPEPVSVPQHRWWDIDTPADAAETPPVSVIIDGDPAAAGPTKAALTEQDPSASPVEILESEAGQSPSGEVVIVVGAGVVPGPGFVAAHARWHTDAAGLVSLGPLGEGDDEPLGLVADLTRDFTDLAGGLHVAAGEGTIGVRRDLFEEAGGMGASPGGAGRLDLMVRLHCAGAVFVPEPGASATGPAPGLARALASACERGETLELSHPELASVVPLPPWRGVAAARRHRQPETVVNVPAGGAPAEESCATIAGALGGSMGDIELRVQIEPSDPAYEAIAQVVDRDERAAIAESSLARPCDAPFQVTLSPAAAIDPRTLGDLHALAIAEDAGACHVTVPGASPQDAMITLVATGAWQRAQRLSKPDSEPVAIIGMLSGERWISGVEVSVRRHGVDEPQVTEHGPLAAATDIDHERNAHLRFRDRARDLSARADQLAQRTLAERLRARRERQAAERAEAKLGG